MLARTNVQSGYGTANAVDDIMSRLETLSDSGGTLATMQYLGLGTIVKETFNQSGVTLNYDPSANNSYSGFDRFGRIIDQKWTNGGGTIDGYTYSYDRSSNVLTKSNATAAALNEVYGYNAINELTSTQRNGSAYQSWNLDGLGNWSSFNNQGTTDTKTFNAVNEQTSSTASVTSVYDAAGNMITTAKAGSPTTGVACKYDAWNRLVSATVGATTVTYQYDGTGRRTQRTVGTAVEHNYYSGQQIILVYNYTGATFTGGNAYIWSPLYVNTPVLRDTYDAAGTLVAASRLYYTTDANHNITSVTNPSGTVLERYSYTSFGDVTVHNPSWTALGNYTASTVSNTRLFGGMAIETITGLFGTFTRWYDSTTGQWIGRDPIESSPNLYAYCNNNPLIYTDPSGNEPAPVRDTPRPPGDTKGLIPAGSFDVEVKPVPINDPNHQKALGGNTATGYVIHYNAPKGACPGGRIVLVQAVDRGQQVLGNQKLTPVPKFDGDCKNGQWPQYPPNIDPQNPGAVVDRPYAPGALTSWRNTVCAVCVHDKPYSQKVLGCVNLVWNDSVTNPSLSVVTVPGWIWDTKVPVEANKPSTCFRARPPGPTWCGAEENYGGEK